MAALARRISSILLATILVLGLFAPAASASVAGDLLALMNAERAAHGLAPVATHADLVDDAAAWSQHLMAQGSLSHNPNLAGVVPSWDKLGENVGVGPSAASLHNSFMSSSSHRANILGDYDYVGIAVAAESETRVWVTVVFLKAKQAPAAEEDPTPYAEEQPAPAGQQPVAATATTRKVAASPAPAPTPPPTIRFVRTKIGPIAD